ncbi:recombinase family protein [Lentzea sp. NPDC060358]|uniref:recombinase family protein n=1 Tax=Lentzea sp. NPDC060358 TaxID=3347103 RepID=UPI0036527B0D
MAALTNVDLLAVVADRRKVPTPVPEAGVRFAFYGRMSTSEFQDPQTSRAWQRAVSDELIEGVGSVVEEFFDVGRSRRWSWSDRPEASALLAAAARSDRVFDAVVIGEYERAFYGGQFRDVVSRLNELGVAVWLPKAGGPVELDSPVHQALMVLLGVQAQREVARARQRVLVAMRAQASQQGRFLGGRPPYGYRLVDGGPHPNARHSGWGRRLQVLASDPVTAPWVRWMFRERAGGRALASIARDLNDRGVSCPSSADPGRNSHRTGGRWMVTAVAAILENPRYTGRQVWNRHGTQGRGAGGRRGGRAAGPVTRNPVTAWEVSEKLSHEPLVDDETFVAVQRIRAPRQARDGGVRGYALAGLVVCGVCDRRMDAHWVHGRPAYRCRHGFNSASTRPPDAPANTYVREDVVLKALPRLITERGHNPESNLKAQLHDLQLEITCVRSGLRLRPCLSSRNPARIHRPTQAALAFDWGSRTPKVPL